MRRPPVADLKLAMWSFLRNLALLTMLQGLPAMLWANTVADWNEAFLCAVRTETTPPCLASRNLAILHIAIYDAVNAIKPGHQSYCFKERAENGTSPEAAASGAAHEVAISLYPSSRADFDTVLTNSLVSVTNATAKTNGLRLGRAAAKAILAMRRNDGASTTVPYLPSNEPGRWRRTPPLYRPPELPQWRFLKPFAMTSAAQFRPPGPPALAGTRYAADVNEVERMGVKASKTRTADQTEIARFWSDFSYTVTTPGHWNDIARIIARQRNMSIEAEARLFALLNIALADAAIVCWDGKYAFDFWRPITAISHADSDDNPDTAPDPGWDSLIVTPPFPEYPSGHSVFSGAAATVLAEVLGADKVSFTVGCDALPGCHATL